MTESPKSPAGAILAANAVVRMTAGTDTLEIKFSAEHWQFFAFLFGAGLAIALPLLDEIPQEAWDWWGPRWCAKGIVTGILGYLCLLDWDVKRWLSQRLPLITTKTW